MQASGYHIVEGGQINHTKTLAQATNNCRALLLANQTNPTNKSIHDDDGCLLERGKHPALAYS